MDEDKPAAQQDVNIERVDDFVTSYANNVQFEPTAWDLKIVFGEVDQAGGKVTVEQHTAVTISWTQAKMMAYYLQLQIAVHELQNGPIQVHKRVWPIVPPPVPADAEEKETAEAIRDLVIKMREEFLAKL